MSGITLSCTFREVKKKKYSKDAFCYDLHKIFQTKSSQSPDPNSLWQEWKTNFLLISDMHAPQMTCKVRLK
jgi:hypothetical protein